MNPAAQQAIRVIQTKMIKPRMKELGITQYRLAKLTGIGESTLSEWFSGKHDISLSKFIQILTALEIKELKL